MSLPRYPRYKDSGVEWLGEVPEHWGVVQSRRLFAQRKERARENDKQLTASQTHGVIDQEDFMEREGRSVMQVIHGADILKHVEPQDFVISMRSFQGGIEWCGERGSISSAYVILIPTSAVQPPFFRYLLKSQRYIQALQSTTNLVRDGQAMRFSNFSQLDLPVVPESEQSVIASFLDRTTVKIDALVEEQRRLIELLKEKRQAVISHAVTKGLNPNAPLKDSGIEWLGEVPQHWEVIPLKRDLKFLTSGSRGWAENYSEEGDLFIRIGNLTREGIVLDLSDIQRVEVPFGAEGARTVVQPGDLLFSITAYLGSVAEVPEGIETAYVSQHVALGRLWKKRLLPRWAAYVTLSNLGKTYLDTQGYGGTKIQLSLDDVANMVMTAPPLDEQRAITRFIDLELVRLDELVLTATRAIDLLKERRTALISAAVTGKIDVRGLAVEEAA